MAWAIITIYISKCAQMNPQQLLKTSKFYSKCKKCDIEKTLRGGYHPPLGSPKVNDILVTFTVIVNEIVLFLLTSIFITVIVNENHIGHSKIN